MKIFFGILVLIFSLQSWTKADGIRDFELEGMSIGDSLLDFFDKDLIEEEKYDPYSLMYKNNEYVQIGASNSKAYRLNIDSDMYDDLSIVLKTKDSTYKIYSIGGRIVCKKINFCKKKKTQIVSELKNLFKDNATIRNDDGNHEADPTGNSKAYSTYFNFKDSMAYVEISIYDWSQKINDEKKFPDNLKVSLISAEFRKFLENVQYNANN